MPDVGANNSAIPATQVKTVPPVSDIPPKPAAISDIKTPNSASIPSASAKPKAESLSPWDDELPPEEAGKKPATVGNLHEAEPLAMPANIDEKVGKKVPATNFIQKILPKKNDTPQTSSATNSQTNVPPANPAPVPSQATAPTPATTTDDWDWFDNAAPSQTPAPPKGPINDQAPKKIVLDNVLPPSPKSPTKQTENTISGINNSASADPAPAGPAAIVSPMKGDQLGTINNVSENPIQVNAANPAAENQASASEKTGFSFLNLFKKRLAEKEENAASVEVIEEKRGIGKTILLMLGGLIALFAILVFLTESGIISIGLENIYGAIGMEKLWGGLPSNAAPALGRAFLMIENNPNYKIKGALTLRIDSSVKSAIVSPLVSLGNSQNKVAKIDTMSSTSAIKATQAADDTYVTDNNTAATSTDADTTSSDSSTQSTTAGNSTTSTDNSTNSSTANSNAASNSSTTPATTTAATSTVSDVVLNVLLKASPAESEAAISLNKNSATENLTLVNSGENLYVRGSSDINYGAGNSSDFVKYQVGKLTDKNIAKDFFSSASASKNFSVKGERVGNEKVDGIRCYKYQIDSLEIGDALSGLGITSDLIQTASGTIWIGIKDKEIHKADLKITTPISSAVTMIQTDLDFYDYGVTNTPSYSNDIKSAESANSTLTGDAKRKNDLQEILTALESYKKDNGVYPVSTSLLKLNQSGNMIEMDLAQYLSQFPADSKSGWYYGYQSNAAGTTCTLTARLENSSDPQGKTSGGITLYYLNGN